MQTLPHLYRASAVAESESLVTLSSPGLPEIPSAPPTEFDGPGDRWSPETLVLAAVADCLTLTLRAVAKASGLAWTSVRFDVEGTLDRLDKAIAFTRIRIKATLKVPAGTEEGLARRVLDKSKRNCIVTASLKAESEMEGVVVVG